MGYEMVSTKATPHIVLRNVTLGYERHPAVHHLSMDIEAGSLLAVVGPNAAGKSTLMKALAGTQPLQTGTMEGSAPNNTAWLSQVSTLDSRFPIDVQGMVMMVLWRHPQACGCRRATEKQRCLDALAAVGLTGFERRSLNSLSGA